MKDRLTDAPRPKIYADAEAAKAAGQAFMDEYQELLNKYRPVGNIFGLTLLFKGENVSTIATVGGEHGALTAAMNEAGRVAMEYFAIPPSQDDYDFADTIEENNG